MIINTLVKMPAGAFIFYVECADAVAASLIKKFRKESVGEFGYTHQWPETNKQPGKFGYYFYFINEADAIAFKFGNKYKPMIAHMWNRELRFTTIKPDIASM